MSGASDLSPAVARAATPPQLLAAVAAADSTRPRLTWYDDAPGPTRGERIELSARVLGTWVAKAANLLADDLGVERGDVVALRLAPHWRTVYWALAAWRVGAVVRLEGDDVEDTDDVAAAVLVTDDVRPGAGAADHVVAVSLPALARRWTGGPGGDAALPAGAVDEAADLASHPDVFEPFDEPEPHDDALVVGGVTRTAAELVQQARALAAEQGWSPQERVAVCATSGQGPAHQADTLLELLAAWSVDGSAVLVRDLDPGAADRRFEAERVTSACDPAGRRPSRP